jgi:2-iminobutanoate/2-iminopropanoate deaminase
MSKQPFFEMFQPEGIYQPETYAHAMRAGNTLYVAGQVSKAKDGEIVAPGDAEAQARQVYHNLGEVLKAANADWSNVVKITTFLVDRADSEAVTRVRLENFGDHRPPHTGLIVAGLGGADVRLEVEVIAVLPD